MERKRLNRAIQPDLKKYVVSSNSKYTKNSSPLMRDHSVSDKRKSNDKINNSKLFAEREKTISATNSLLTHGLRSRRSRAGKLSKVGLKINEESDDDDKNKTTLVFPTIENSAHFEQNLGNF